ncbi:hypothetical protein OG521_38265 [Streptomyces sp. NBC_01463]
MNVELRLLGEGVSDSDVASIRQQLTAHRDLRGHVSTVSAEPDEGAMGSGTELLLVGLGSGGALTALVTTLPALLQARRSAATVEVTLADGRSATITADSAKDARLLLEEALRDRSRP